MVVEMLEYETRTNYFLIRHPSIPTLGPIISPIGLVPILPPFSLVQCSESRSEHLDAVLRGGIDSLLGAGMKVVGTPE